MSPESRFYFAYGANMSARQLAKRLRCSDVTALKRRAAVLPDYRLTFDKLSSSDPTIGYANIVPDPGDTVITFQPGTNRPGHLAVH